MMSIPLNIPLKVAVTVHYIGVGFLLLGAFMALASAGEQDGSTAVVSAAVTLLGTGLIIWTSEIKERLAIEKSRL